jgi:DNA repair protein RadC
MAALRSLPLEERPRERLLRDGVNALSIPELIAIILGSGMQGKSVLELAQEIFSHFGNLDRLLGATIVELMEIKGVGRAKAIQLKAVLGIASKSKQVNAIDKFPILSPMEAYVLVKGEIAEEKREIMMVLLRDIRGRLIHKEPIAVGTLSQILIHPREVFHAAVRHKAYSMIIAHNHPSGDPTPSEADLELTRALIQSGRVMGIGLDDHLIVCRDAFTSLRERGFIPRKDRY